MFVLLYKIYYRSYLGSSALAFQVLAFASSHGAKMSDIQENRRRGSKSGSGSRAGSTTRCRNATEARQLSATRKPAKDGTVIFCFSYATEEICRMQGLNCGAKHLHSCKDEGQVKELVDTMFIIEDNCIEKDAIRGLRGKGLHGSEALQKHLDDILKQKAQGSRNFQAAARGLHAFNIAEQAWIYMHRFLEIDVMPIWLTNIFDRQKMLPTEPSA